MCSRGRVRGFRWLFEGSSARDFVPAAPFPRPHPSSFLSLSHLFAVFVARTNLSSSAHAHLSGVVCLAFHPAEKQDGDLWDSAGRRHLFNGLPKRLNFVADPAIRAGFRRLHAFEALSLGVTVVKRDYFNASGQS